MGQSLCDLVFAMKTTLRNYRCEAIRAANGHIYTGDPCPYCQGSAIPISWDNDHHPFAAPS